MKLQQLRYVIEITKHHFNVSAAANTLYTSQSGISRQIRSLEYELGVDIFERHGRHLIGLTLSGREVLSMARSVIHQVDTLKSTLQVNVHNRHHSLCIGVTNSQHHHWLLPLILSSSDQYPDLEIKVYQSDAIMLMQWLESGKVDVGITSDSLSVADGISLPCYQWHYALCLPNNHELSHDNVSLFDLQNYPLIVERSSSVSITHKFQKKGIKPNIICTADSVDVLHSYVGSEQAIGIWTTHYDDLPPSSNLIHWQKAPLSLGYEQGHLWFKKDAIFTEAVVNFLSLLSSDFYQKMNFQSHS